MSEHIGHGHENDPKPKDDCGCGCNGAGDCNEVTEPSQKARRALMVGAGSVAFVATLMNRRAFGAECGPVSHAASLHHSGPAGPTNCGGASPGFWKNHAGCVTSAIGNPANVTLESVLSNLSTVDPTSGSTTFLTALCASNTDASHWANAILSAIKIPTQYGYTITTLNAAILKAFNQHVSLADILAALETLEGAVTPSGCDNSHLPCP